MSRSTLLPSRDQSGVEHNRIYFALSRRCNFALMIPTVESRRISFGDSTPGIIAQGLTEPFHSGGPQRGYKRSRRLLYPKYRSRRNRNPSRDRACSRDIYRAVERCDKTRGVTCKRKAACNRAITSIQRAQAGNYAVPWLP